MCDRPHSTPLTHAPSYFKHKMQWARRRRKTRRRAAAAARAPTATRRRARARWRRCGACSRWWRSSPTRAWPLSWRVYPCELVNGSPQPHFYHVTVHRSDGHYVPHSPLPWSFFAFSFSVFFRVVVVVVGCVYVWHRLACQPACRTALFLFSHTDHRVLAGRLRTPLIPRPTPPPQPTPPTNQPINHPPTHSPNKPTHHPTPQPFQPRQGTYEQVERAVGRLISRAEQEQGKQDPVAVVGRGYHTMLSRAVKEKVGSGSVPSRS